MSVYKSLTTSDVVVTPFKVNKSFTFCGVNSLSSVQEEIVKEFGPTIPGTANTLAVKAMEWFKNLLFLGYQISPEDFAALYGLSFNFFGAEGFSFGNAAGTIGTLGASTNTTLTPTNECIPLNDPNVQITRYIGTNITSSTFDPNSNQTGLDTILNQELVYNSVKQLYYTNYLRGKDGSPVLTSSIAIDGIRNGEGGVQPSYDNYLPNTLLADRSFPTGSNEKIGLISIPSGLFGEHIKPGSFTFSYSGSLATGSISDDGKGGVILDGTKIGDIIYQHGMIILTGFNTSNNEKYGVGLNSGYGTARYAADENTNLFEIVNSPHITCSFESTMTIYESQYKCTFNPNEFIYSQNPTIISGSSNSGVVYDFATGSYFEPYITTVGLYNNSMELIAVGKLAQPLQSSNVTDTTVLVNLDL